jgi:hypothetical protein
MNCMTCGSVTEVCPARSIPVVYWNDTYGIVKDFILDELISGAEIKKFYRSGGWAILGCHPIRLRARVNLGTLDRRGMPYYCESDGEGFLPAIRII